MREIKERKSWEVRGTHLKLFRFAAICAAYSFVFCTMVWIVAWDRNRENKLNADQSSVEGSWKPSSLLGLNLLLGGTGSFWLYSFQFPWGAFCFPFDFLSLFFCDGPATFTEFISPSESASSPSLLLTNNKSQLSNNNMTVLLFHYYLYKFWFDKV